MKLADAPGTQKAQPGPRCSPCYKGSPKRGQVRATKCVDCKRALRPRDATTTEYPGTVLHWGQSRCQSCWREERGITKSRRNTRPTHCKDCEEPLRGHHSTLAEFPGTVRHVGHGICKGCQDKRRAKARKPKPVPAPKPVTVTAPKPVEDVPNVTDPGLLRLRAERNERRRRQEQAQRIRAEQEAVQRRFIARRKAAA